VRLKLPLNCHGFFYMPGIWNMRNNKFDKIEYSCWSVANEAVYGSWKLKTPFKECKIAKMWPKISQTF
jgi:hypothetical protein